MSKNKKKKKLKPVITNNIDSHEPKPMAVRRGIAVDPSVPVSNPVIEPNYAAGSGLNAIIRLKISKYQPPIL